MIMRGWARLILGVVAALSAVMLLAPSGVAGADPDPTGQPTVTAPETSDPPAPSAAPDDGGPELDIKAGTPKEGKIRWDEFGGPTEDAPETLDGYASMLIGYALTIVGSMAMISGLIVLILMGVGFKGRSSVAKAALESSIWLFIGVVVVGSVSTIAGIMLAGAGLI